MSILKLPRKSACATYPHLFDPPDGKGDSTFAQRQQAAIELCYNCPFLEACQQWALHHGPRDNSTIGGLTGKERRESNIRTDYSYDSNPFTINGGCSRGHPEKHLYLRPNGTTRCRTCEHTNNVNASIRRKKLTA